MANRNAPVDTMRCWGSIQQELQEFAARNGQLPDQRLVTVLDAYLRWNGIVGYTAPILNIIEATGETSNAQ